MTGRSPFGEEPDAAGLVEIALAAFRDEILPGVPGEHRFAALMIANALAIAQRELASPEAGAGPAAAIAALLGTPPAPLDEAQRQLVRTIEAGRFDGRQPALRAVLDTLVRARLAISNPRRAG